MKKPTVKKLKIKLWEECKRITRKRHGNTCYTCYKEGLEGHNWQTGHAKPKGALSLRFQYDLRGLRPQCLNCNIHYGGMTDIFVGRLEKEKEGLEFLNDCCVKEDGVWRIKSVPLMGGKDSYIFVDDLLKEYAKL